MFTTYCAANVAICLSKYLVFATVLCIGFQCRVNHWSNSAYTTQGALLPALVICLRGLRLTVGNLARGNMAMLSCLTTFGRPLAVSYALALLCLVYTHTYKHIPTLADGEDRQAGLA